MFIEIVFARCLRNVCRHKSQLAAKSGQGLVWRDTLKKNVLTTQLLVVMCVDEVMLFPHQTKGRRGDETDARRLTEASKQGAYEYDSILAAK